MCHVYQIEGCWHSAFQARFKQARSTLASWDKKEGLRSIAEAVSGELL